MKIIGTAAPRVDGIEKVTGRAKYTGDMVVPGMLEGKFLRSPYAHARIVGIDTSAAEKIPGVAAVLIGKQLTDFDPYLGRGEKKDRPIMAIDRVLYAGEPVAAVAAVDNRAATAALGAIQVEYKELPAVITIAEALADGASQLHSFAPKNICFQDAL